MKIHKNHRIDGWMFFFHFVYIIYYVYNIEQSVFKQIYHVPYIVIVWATWEISLKYKNTNISNKILIARRIR